MSANLVQIWIDIPEMEMQESLQATLVAPSLYRVEEIPFTSKEINYYDIVRCVDKGEAPREVVDIVKASGYQSLQASFDKSVSVDDVIKHIHELKQLKVTYRRSGTHLFTFNISPDVDYQAVMDFLDSLVENDVIRLNADREGIAAAESVMRNLTHLTTRPLKLENGKGRDKEFGL